MADATLPCGRNRCKHRHCRALVELYAAIGRDPALQRQAQSARQLVTGCGDPQARVALVGEAPGATEDGLGVPFVGAAGQLLRELLSEVGLPPDQCWITNAVKYRPLGNRTPAYHDLAAWRPYLRREIEIIEPELIVVLGASSWRLVSAVPISQARGELVRRGRWCYLPTWHPSYVLRTRGGSRDQLRGDLVVAAGFALSGQ